MPTRTLQLTTDKQKNIRKGQKIDKDPYQPQEKSLNDILIMALNVNGLRQKRKVTALGKYISSLKPQPDICVLSETHLYEDETDKFCLETYHKAHSSCREPDEEQAKGGVLILVKERVSYTKAVEMPSVSLPLHSCSIWLHLNNKEMPVVRLTGIYFPPSAKPTLSAVEMLTDRRSFTAQYEVQPGHIIAGDFNHPSWTAQYEEWVATYGIWELTDPDERTFSSGNSLDKFLYAQGGEIPAFLLGDGALDPDQHSCETHYPGSTGTEEAVGNHHPIFLSLPHADAKPPPHCVKLCIKGVTEESWKERNTRLQQLIVEKQPSIVKLTADGNATRLHALMNSLLKSVTKDLYLRKKRKGANDMKDPFKNFCKQHRHHHLLTQLRIYHHAGNKNEEESVMNKIIREDWRSYLAKTKPNNITGIYKYIRKRDGREPRTYTHQCSAPLQENGRTYTDPKEKCELLATFFHQKLTDPNIPQALLNRASGNIRGKVKKKNLQRDKTLASLEYRTPPTTTTNIASEILEDFAPFREIETKKAVAELAGNKATGPDGIPGDLYKRLPAIIPLLTNLITAIVQKGHIPWDLRQVLPVPLDKPGKDNKLCSSKRPISLINTTIKVIEGVVYNRSIHQMETLFHPSHYAYRRSRGTDAHLNGLTHDMLTHLQQGSFTYLASLDIQGAFDTLPHNTIQMAIESARLEPKCAQFMMNWTQGRSFKVRLTTSRGQYHSKIRRVTRGLPQGGILSPAIWVLVFSEFSRITEQNLETDPYLRQNGVFWKFYIYADDIVFIVVHDDAEVIVKSATIISEEVEKTLRSMGLFLGHAKCNNMVVSPEETVGGFYRRNNNLTITTNKELPNRDAHLSDLLKTFQEDKLPPGIFPTGKKQRLPYAYSSLIKILGVYIDEHLGLQHHYGQIIKRARVRHGVMATLAQRRWGLDVGILRSTHAALLTSLMTYGLAATGGLAYESCLDRLETQQTNIAARRITGVSKSARLAILHMVADVLSARNLMIQQCGLAIDRTMRIHHSAIHTETARWLAQLYQMDAWSTEWKQLNTQEHLMHRKGTRNPGEYGTEEMTETWVIRQLTQEPRFTGGEWYKVPSIYYTEADLIMIQPQLKQHTYSFHGTNTAKEVGLQVLLAADWRPDCTTVNVTNVERLIPPETHQGKRILFGPPEANSWLPADEVYALGDAPPDENNVIRIEVMSRMYQKWGLTMAYIRFPTKDVRVETRFWGFHQGECYPKYNTEAPMLHALEIVRWINSKPVNCKEKSNSLYYVIEAGNPLTCTRLGKWFTTGKWYLQSAAGEGIARILHELAPILNFTLICYSFTSNKPETGEMCEHLDVGWTVLETTYIRAKKLIRAGILDECKHKAARIPLTADEVKDAIKLRYAVDEGKAIYMLKGQSSTAAEVIIELGLTRDVIRQALERLEYSRAKQVVLCSILCTTRFKYYESQGLLRTTCLKCGALDSFHHLVQCAALTIPTPSQDTDHMVDFLVRLTNEAYQINPGLPRPRGIHDGEEREQQRSQHNSENPLMMEAVEGDDQSLTEWSSAQEAENIIGV